MKILDNELVRRYFGCNCPPEQNMLAGYHPENCSDKAVALKVLAAMEEPIKNGELYLIMTSQTDWKECVNDAKDCEGYHPWGLRLPDRFQPSEKPKECECVKCKRAEAEYCRECAMGEFKTQPPPSEKPDYCPHGIKAWLIYPCTECTAKLNNQPPPTPEKCDHGNFPGRDKCPACKPANSPEIEAKIEDISELICHWFSNGPVGTPNPDSLSILLRALVKLAREGK